MKIVQICTSDLRHGAGIAAYRLHTALNRAGSDSTLIVAQKFSKDERVLNAKPEPINLLSKIYRWGQYGLELTLNLLGPQNVYSCLSEGLADHPAIQQADVIHLHNIHWPFRNFSLNLLKIGKRKPLLWTFHDMWPLTGHCFYSLKCNRWEIGCGQCPQLLAFVPILYDSSAYQWQLKKKIYSATKITVITPSRWLCKIAQQSPLLKGQRIENIPNCIDQDIFKPEDRTLARQKLGLQENSKALLFVASNVNLPIKGLPYIKKAIPRIKSAHGETVLVTVGKGKVPEEIKKMIKVKELGPIKDPKELAKIYSAADLSIVPSFQDNLPYTVMEPLACGTPVVTFNTGGISDMVDHRVNGYLAEPNNSDDLAEGINLFLNDAQLSLSARKNAAEKVNACFSYEKIANRHLQLYQRSLENFRTNLNVEDQ